MLGVMQICSSGTINYYMHKGQRKIDMSIKTRMDLRIGGEGRSDKWLQSRGRGREERKETTAYLETRFIFLKKCVNDCCQSSNLKQSCMQMYTDSGGIVDPVTSIQRPTI